MSSLRPSIDPAAPGTFPSPALWSLPAPRHLFEFLTRSRHQHLGYFEVPSDSVAQAQDRLILRAARLLSRNSLVADVGCGLGGAVDLLAAQGHTVFGLDPCPHSIAYARAHAHSPRARFLEVDLAGFAARARGARFDALFLTEVLPEVGDLPGLFAHCRALLRPGGLVVVHDVVREPLAPASAAAFLARGALRSAADAVGFDLMESRDLTNRTAPTLSRLARAAEERRAEVLSAFAATRPEVARELDAFDSHLRALELAFSRQELFFETTVLRCSARFTNDSVVLRPRSASLPVERPTRR